MIESIAVTGMVIASSPINEYDRRVVLLTKERGKISGFARGARRQHSSMLASTQAFAFGVFRVVEGRDSYSIIGAEISNYFEEIPKDPFKACYGSYFLEVAGYYGRENNNEVALLKLLYQTLRILCRDVVPAPLIRVIFEFKTLVVNGEYPECFHCVACGLEKDLNHFSVFRSGMICDHCLGEGGPVLLVNPSTLYALQYIITSSIEKLYTFNVSPEVLAQLQRLMSEYMREHIDRTFKSLEILDMMTDMATFRQ